MNDEELKKRLENPNWKTPKNIDRIKVATLSLIQDKKFRRYSISIQYNEGSYMISSNPKKYEETPFFNENEIIETFNKIAEEFTK